ncbi:AAA family ATPase [Clostridium sp. AN503]|uniref:AAA family ATPase n=1 Tax=Clostridium sp. AN503 TaxID=3160598 RepID=UPI0034583DCA
MNVQIRDCNNIVQGEILLREGCLNIKYAINGTGKSTIAKAISASVSGDANAITALTPFHYLPETEGHIPSISGLTGIESVRIFNDEYVGQFVFQSDEVIQDSFSIFVKTSDYDAHMLEIQNLLSEINFAFQNHPELDSLIQNFTQFIDGFGKAKSGYSAAGSIGKGFGKGNKIINIPQGLEAYAPYLTRTQDASNVKWLKWQLEGKTYLDFADQCPYCSGSVKTKKEAILKITEEYDSKSIEHLNKMLLVFEELMPYFSDNTAAKICEIRDNVAGITKAQQNYLTEVKNQVETLLALLRGLKHLGFESLKKADKITDELKKYIIDLSYFTHLNSATTCEKIKIINASLNTIMQVAGKLQGEIIQQNRLVQKTVEENSSAINEFLLCAGYNYIVAIDETADQKYKMVLKPRSVDTIVDSAKNRLSYGERNAFALVLFMFSALKENPDLVILDDPISSFDGNKKFAIINMLFLSKHSLKNRTVLLLTHEFNTVIDIIHTMPQNFNPNPVAAFLTIKGGFLSEKAITKSDICSFSMIAKNNINATIDNLNREIYLRRLLEAEGKKDKAWHLLSNLFHKRKQPTFPDENGLRLMTQEEIIQAEMSIREYIPSFNYDTEYEKTQNIALLVALYNESTSNYEKLQIYRIIFNENNGNRVVRKFVNETFHVENDYLFQLNPREYDTIPQYIIDECDKDIMAIP